MPVPAGGSDRTAASTGTGTANGTAGSNLSSNVKRTQSATAASLRRAVYVPADPSEVPRAEASSSDGHDDGILSSIADNITSGTIVADGLQGLTDTEAAETARALTQGKVETDAGMLPSVAKGKGKNKGKDEAALRAAGLTSSSSTGPASSSTGSSTGNIRRAKAAAASGAALRRSVSPAAQAAAEDGGDAGADIAATAASAAEQLVPPPLQEGDEGKYIEEDDGRSDVGLFVGSTAAGHRDISGAVTNASTERHLGVAASACPADGTWVDCFEATSDLTADDVRRCMRR